MIGWLELSPLGPNPRPICIVQPKIGVLTETFIEAHYRHLRPPRFRLECDPFPIHTETGSPLVSMGQAWVHRLAFKLLGLDDRRADRALARRVPDRFRIAALARHFRRLNVGVVLAEYGPTGVSVLPACQLSKTPLVVHFHGYDAYMHDVVAANRPGYDRLFESASAIIAVSQHMRRHLIGLGAPSDKVMFNPYGIELEDFKGARPDRNPPIFLAVGRFVEKKGPQFTIRAFSKTATAIPGSQLIMVGDGPLLGSCFELVSRLGLDANVSLIGSRPHGDVARLMAGSRCFVQHSVTPASGDMEGTPLAVLEAMASGLPVVATRHGGISDVVREGTSGFLVDERDVETMADAMMAIASDLKTAAAFGVAGRDIVMRSYSMEVSIRQLGVVLDEAILKPPPLQ